MTANFNHLRNNALARARELGLPKNRMESWRYVDLSRLALTAPAVPANRRKEMGLPSARTQGPGLIFANGLVDPRSAAPFPKGVEGKIWAGDLIFDENYATELSAQLAQTQDVSVAWSIADMRSAARLVIKESIDQPLVIANLATEGERGGRLFIDIEAGASVHLILIHTIAPWARSSLGIDVRVGPMATFKIDDLDVMEHKLGGTGELFTHLNVSLAERAQAKIATATSGGRLVRRTLQADLKGPHAQIDIAGAISLPGDHQAHHFIRVNHQVGTTTSRQDFRLVAADSSQISFDGLVSIARGADGSDSAQKCLGLQLGEQARISARPQLDILADDVQATHGASIGQPDADQLLYLRSRGLTRDIANSLMIRSFLTPALDAFNSSLTRELAASRTLALNGRSS